MTANLYDAFRQWAYRPADERFPSLDAMYEFARFHKDHALEQQRSLSSLVLSAYDAEGISVNGTSEPAALSHWSFGQLATLARAPASYLRSLPAELARDCLSYGLKQSEESCKVLVRGVNSGNGSDVRTAAAFTGPNYGRIWDADVIANIRGAASGTAWHTPPARRHQDSENAGLYSSDHDMFVFMINEEKPVKIGNAELSRGFFCWNSETGAASFGLTTFLYNWVCSNHIVWQAEDVKELKIIHRVHAPEYFYERAMPTLNRFATDSLNEERIRYTVERAASHTTGRTIEEATEYFKSKPFTQKELAAAWQASSEQGEDPTTLWGMVQGFTAVARDLPYVDKRVNLERRAGALLSVDS